MKKWMNNNLVAIIAIVVGFVLWYVVYSKAPGNLVIRHVVDADLIGNRVKNLPLKISWEDRIGMMTKSIDIKSLQLTVLSFENSGDEVFDWKDRVVSPIEIELPEGAKLLYAYFMESASSDANTPYVLDTTPIRKLLFTVPIINPQERFRVAMYHTGKSKEFIVKGRIKGQSTPAITRAK